MTDDRVGRRSATGRRVRTDVAECQIAGEGGERWRRCGCSDRDGENGPWGQRHWQRPEPAGHRVAGAGTFGTRDVAGDQLRLQIAGL